MANGSKQKERGGTGVMADCTKAEVREAHRLAMENMSAIWSV